VGTPGLTQRIKKPESEADNTQRVKKQEILL
jgi:hypothetical protein